MQQAFSAWNHLEDITLLIITENLTTPSIHTLFILFHCQYFIHVIVILGVHKKIV